MAAVDGNTQVVPTTRQVAASVGVLITVVAAMIGASWYALTAKLDVFIRGFSETQAAIAQSQDAFAQVLASVETDVADMRNHMIESERANGERLANHGELITALRGEIRLLARSHEDLAARLDASRAELGTRIDTLETDLSTRIDTTYADLSTRIDTLETDLSRRLEATYADLSTRIETSNGSLRGEIAEVRETVGRIEASHTELKAEIAGLSADVSELRAGGARISYEWSAEDLAALRAAVDAGDGERIVVVPLMIPFEAGAAPSSN